MWTHITACLSVDTGLVEPRGHVKKVITKELKEAPKITGSEGAADVYVNVPSGYNCFIGRDCCHCPHYTGEADCEPPHDFECPEGRYQTRVVISIQGDLRDRMKDQTRDEFKEFLKFIECRYLLRDYAVNIEGDI
jgi:hypothetical protein